jgi:hypothetical protein
VAEVLIITSFHRQITIFHICESYDPYAHATPESAHMQKVQCHLRMLVLGKCRSAHPQHYLSSDKKDIEHTHLKCKCRASENHIRNN